MSRGATARLFVALDPPLEVREALSSWARLAAAGSGSAVRARREERPDGDSAAAIRLLDADSLHLTLCFLGSRPVEEIGPLAAALGEWVLPVGELSVGAPVLLPPRRPRSLAVEIHDRDGDLARLQAQVLAGAGRAIGWEPAERRGFRAHVTVARMRADTRLSPAGQPLPVTPRLSFRPQTIVLYRSWLAPEGASYETVASSELPATAG